MFDGSIVQAIAVIGGSNEGILEYSTDGGNAWLQMDNDLSDNHALLLSANDLIRFIPEPGYSGVSGFTFRAWDESSGAVGAYTEHQH